MWKSTDFLDCYNRIFKVSDKCKSILELKHVTIASLPSTAVLLVNQYGPV
jgi:hypothetical protein